MVESLLREAMDEAQIPRGRDLTPPGGAPEGRRPLILFVDSDFELSAQEALLSEADAIVIRLSDPSAVQEACAAVCRRARRGQTIVLTSAGYVGATRDLLVRPLEEAGFKLGVDICVAFSPERIGLADALSIEARPRVLGSGGCLCTEKARAVLEALTESVHVVSSLEAAEIAKLYGDLFRTVNVALAEELAEAAGALGLAPAEIVEAVALASD